MQNVTKGKLKVSKCYREAITLAKSKLNFISKGQTTAKSSTKATKSSMLKVAKA